VLAADIDGLTMDNQRLILFILFTFSVFMLFEAWQRETRPPVSPTPVAASTPSGPAQTAVPAATQPLSAAPAPAAAQPAPTGALQRGDVVRVETDLFVADINTAGGDLRRLELLGHRATLDKTKNMLLMQEADHTYIAQAGLIGNGLPNHRTRFTAEGKAYKLADGAASLAVRLVAPEAEGLKVTKVYTFHRGRYEIDVTFEVENKGTVVAAPDAYFQLVRDGKPPEGDSAMLPTFTGVAVYTDREKFQKLAFGDIDKNKASYPKKSNDGWIAFLQHYFLSAWLPKAESPREYYVQRGDNGLYSAGVILAIGKIEPGSTGALSVPLYAGPQEQDKLAVLAPGLDLTVDYGWLTVIAKPLFWFLQWLYQWVGNWGTAIILLTVTIKLVFYPLSAASYRSMARMRVVAPKMQRLKEQYGDDRQRMSQAMMELYRTEKINPLGGCLPVVVQIPVFIALYWVLLASVELRHAPFMLWINDLSNPDPWFVLPTLMGATMILQTYLNPEPPDPVQAKIMKIMPIAFSIMFFFFPAGLVLYWLINNVLSIAQQWQITRAMESAQPAHGK
jgi:YidC/Oxa1 family membrane protein insertase